MPALYIQQLRYLDRGPIDLTIEPGECVALAGPSGSGKTLMVRAIADLDPHDGQVRLGEEASAAVPAPTWRKRVGLLPAESQWWHDQVGDHFAAPGGMEPPAGSEDASCNDWLTHLGFPPDVMDWEVSRLSTGEKQRLALVRLLCNRPQALLLDEPTASLDPQNVGKVEDLVTEQRKSWKMPVLWITHDPQQMPRIADRGFRLDASGRLAEQVHP